MRHPFIGFELVFKPTLVIFGIALLLGGSAIWLRPKRTISVLLFVAVVTLPFVCLAQAFGNVEVLSLIFHVHFGVEDAGLAGFGPEIVGGALLVFYLVFVSYALANLLNWHKTIYALGTIALVLVSPLTAYAIQYGTSQQIDSDLHERVVQPKITPPAVQPDIVMIYLEGLERAFAQQDVFGDVFEPLLKYEQQGISFTSVRQVRGTGWSLAGLVATQCGVPLMPRGLRSHYDFDEEADFLLPLDCLSGVLADRGYQNTFVVGGSQDFGGFNHFFATHKIANVYDRAVIRTRYSVEEFDAAWQAHVVDDQMVLETATALYDEKVSGDAPMLLMVETYGPHGAASVLSRGCTASGHAEMAPDPAAAVVCTLKDVDLFLDHVAANRAGRPTVVVLASDHLNHDPVIKSSFTLRERSNTVIMYSLGRETSAFAPGTRIARPASMIDVYPTLLAFAGFAEPNAQAGLGRSLFGTTPTMVEEKGHAGFNAELFPNPRLSRAIWGDDTK